MKTIVDDSSLKGMVERPTISGCLTENAVGPIEGCREIPKSTPEQITVGKWLESALMIATGKTGELSRDEVLRQYSELTAEVATIDALARANGARPPVAYIGPERLEELVNGKAPNVQITVSSTQPRVQDEKYVTIDKEQPPVVSKDQATTVETTQHENDKALAVPNQQGEDRKSSQQAPERVAKGRESNQERQEPKQIERPQVQKTREPMKDQSNVKSEEQPRVGKFTLLDLRNIQQGNVALNKPEITPPLNAQIHPVAVTKTDNGESKFGTEAPVRVIDATNSAPISSEHAPRTLDENHNIAPKKRPSGRSMMTISGDWPAWHTCISTGSLMPQRNTRHKRAQHHQPFI